MGSESESFEFLLFLLRRGLLGANEQESVPELGRIDWKEFRRIVSFHRVLDFVVPQLSTIDLEAVPKWVLDDLGEELKQQRMQRLRHLALLSRIAAAFSTAGISYVILKGPVVAQWIHGDPCGRHFKDLDILVPEEEIPRALEKLRRVGVVPCSEFSGLERFHWKHRTMACQHFTLYTKTGECVELHWRVRYMGGYESYSYFKDKLDVYSVSGIEICSLKPQALFDFLLEHGDGHLWFRLKWLADIVPLVEGADEKLFDLNSGKVRNACRNVLVNFGFLRVESRSTKSWWNRRYESLVVELIGVSNLKLSVRQKVWIRIVQLARDGVSKRRLRKAFWMFVSGRLVRAVPLPRALWVLYVPLAPFAAAWIQFKQLFSKSADL